jgi:hypothetical protein
VILIPAVGGPGWTDILTAIGTTAAVIAAVGIAWWSYLQARNERARSHEQEQLTEAYAVRVVQGERPADRHSTSHPSVVVLVATVVNGGHYTITGVEVVFCIDGEHLMPPATSERVSSFAGLPDGLRKPTDTSQEQAMAAVLAPWDTGMRSESGEVPVECLKGHYALVCWTDEWGQRWEHKLGKVRRVPGDEEWAPKARMSFPLWRGIMITWTLAARSHRPWQGVTAGRTRKPA